MCGKSGCIGTLPPKLKPQTSSLKPQASSLKPQASSLKPQASSLKPQASSLKPQAYQILAPRHSEWNPVPSMDQPLTGFHSE